MELQDLLALALTITALLFAFYEAHRARLEKKGNDELKKTFRAFVAGLYAPTARAIQWAQDMRGQTHGFESQANSGMGPLARRMCLQAGRMEMHVHDQAAMIAKFAQEYLHQDLPRWREITQELDENRNTAATASQRDGESQ